MCRIIRLRKRPNRITQVRRINHQPSAFGHVETRESQIDMPCSLGLQSQTPHPRFRIKLLPGPMRRGRVVHIPRDRITRRIALRLAHFVLRANRRHVQRRKQPYIHIFELTHRRHHRRGQRLQLLLLRKRQSRQYRLFIRRERGHEAKRQTNDRNHGDRAAK